MKRAGVLVGQSDGSGEEPDVSGLQVLIVTVRGQRVMIDADLARVYGVSTKALLQAVRRNVERFPFDFMFQMTS